MFKKCFLSMIFVLFLIMGYAGFATAQTVQPGSNQVQAPEKIIQEMLIKLDNVKSFEYSGEIKAEIKENNLSPSASKETIDFLINYTGKFDIQEWDKPKGLFSFNIKINAETEMLSQEEFIIEVEMIIIGEIFYVKLNNITDIGHPGIDAFKGQWIKIDTGILKDRYGLGEIEAQLKEAQKKKKLFPEQQIEQLKLLAGIIEVTGNLPIKKIEGMDNYHYQFTVSKEKFTKLLVNMMQGALGEEFTEEEVADISKEFEGIQFPNGEIWIDKENLLPYKFVIPNVIFESEPGITGNINFTFSFKNFNKPVKVDIPEESISSEEIMGGL